MPWAKALGTPSDRFNLPQALEALRPTQALQLAQRRLLGVRPQLMVPSLHRVLRVLQVLQVLRLRLMALSLRRALRRALRPRAAHRLALGQ